MKGTENARSTGADGLAAGMSASSPCKQAQSREKNLPPLVVEVVAAVVVVVTFVMVVIGDRGGGDGGGGGAAASVASGPGAGGRCWCWLGM